MSMFKNMFGISKVEPMPDVLWNYLENEQQLEELKKASFIKPVAIFKHSTRCSISRMAWNQFQRHYTISNDKMDLYHLDLLEYRSISSAIAEQFQVEHQSPQLIVIKDGVAVYNTSHESIDAKNLEGYV